MSPTDDAPTPRTTEPDGRAPGTGREPPARSGVRRGLLLALASVAVLAVGLVDLAVTGVPAATPTPAPPASPGAVAPTSRSTDASSGRPSPSGGSPAAPSPADVEGQVAAIERTIPAIRDLQPTRAVPNRIIDEPQLRRDMTRLFDEENPPARVAVDQALLERMGLLPAGFDLRSRYLDALGTGVAGYYDDRTRAMTIVQRSAAFGPVERLTLAHEYTHALQDMHFGLSSLEGTDTTQGDRSLARTSLIEGDASLAMARYAQRYLTPADLLAVAATAGDPAQTSMLRSLPTLLRRQIEFPYVEGLSFVSALYARGGWAAVDAAYATPPASTSQILHPDLYVSGVQPVAVTLPEVPAALGSGWKLSTTDTAGEMATGVWLSDVAGSTASAAIAAGWAGDRVGSYDGPNGAWVAVWVTAWTGERAASSFAEAAGAADASGSAAPAASTRRVLRGPGADRVTVVIGSDAATVARLAGAIGG